jgi:lipoprotein NlpD
MNQFWSQSMMVCSVRNKSVEQLSFIGSAYIVTSFKAIALLLLLIALAGCAGSGTGAPIFGGGSDSSASGGGEYTVASGDTLSKISRATGVSVSSLMSLNNISDPRQLRVGQRLRLGTASASAEMQQGDSDSTIPAKPTRTRAEINAANEKANEKASDVGNSSRAANANTLNLQWPAKGKVIEGFTPTNKGIDIGGTLGEPIYAAADGKVEFADNGGRGLGNLVILSHEDGFITAYAHNQELIVKSGSQVKKGAKIATMGQSEASSPRLHFEVRRNGTALDPLRYLPPQ